MASGDPLADAARAYRAALADIDTVRELAHQEAARRVQRARDKADRARAELARAIASAARRGVRQRDIVAVTGYSRERIRQIVRAAGIQ